jgi:hypothetical protein
MKDPDALVVRAATAYICDAALTAQIWRKSGGMERQ